MSASPVRSSAVTAAQLSDLQAERARIKHALYAEHGATIDAMMRDMKAANGGGPVECFTPAQEQEHRLQNILANRTPLRRLVVAAQSDAIERLVAHAKESAARGEDVRGRLDMLMGMRGETSSKVSEGTAPVDGDAGAS